MRSRASWGWGIIDTVAGHSNDVAAILQCVDDIELVFGKDLGKTIAVFHLFRVLIIQSAGFLHCSND